ncbi:MAG: DUF3365 domain-containing protein [Candidatus Zixiibacteriota bacterium]
MKWIFLVSAALLLAACSSESPSVNKTTDEDIAACEKIIADFQSELKAELVSAMSQGGPENAIGVCNTKAAEIESTYNALDGIEIRRVSLRQRNARYVPDEFETIVLKTFESMKSAEPKAHHELLSDNAGGQTFRYMKEIKAGKLCLNCHGDPQNFSDGLKAKLAELYPDDVATGYAEGDSRGAFSVILTLPAARNTIESLTMKSAE